MRWPGILATLLLGLALPPPAAADWLQDGYDAARTGNTAAQGPAWPDIALTHTFPAAFDPTTLTTRPGAPLVVNGTAYILAREDNLQLGGAGTTWTTTIQAIDLATGATKAVLSLPEGVQTFVSDGDAWFIVTRSSLHVYHHDWSPAWQLPLYLRAREQDAAAPEPTQESVGREDDLICGHAAVDEGFLFLACTVNYGVVVQAFGIDLAAKRIAWSTLRNEAFDPPSVDPTSPTNLEGPLQPYWQGMMDDAVVLGVTVLDDAVVVTWHGTDCGGASPQEPMGTPCPTSWEYWALSRDGVHQWLRGGSPVESIATPSDATTTGSNVHGRLPPLATAAFGTLYVEHFTTVLRLNPEDGEIMDTWSLQEGEGTQGDPGSGFAADDTSLYVTSTHALARRDGHTGREDWTFMLPPEETWGPTQPALAGGRLYMSSEARPANAISGRSSLYCLDANSGEVLWRHDVTGVLRFAVSEDVVVAQSFDVASVNDNSSAVSHYDGTTKVEVLGQTPASLHLDLDLATAYPANGAEIRVRIRAQEGALGPATLFRADWGDGEVSDWGNGTTFTHRYSVNNEHRARFYASNGNQTASIAQTFLVGQLDPTIQIWDDPWGDRYQNTTFFFLGLLVTGLVALLGLWRSGRKRRRFERELRQLEQDAERLRGDAVAYEAMLNERRARARALFLERRIEEAHAGFLEKRVDDLQRSLRSIAVDEQLRFLSHGLVLRLKRMLADARVDATERADVLDALDREPIPATRRSEVRRLVEGWFLRDAEGA